MSMGPIISAEPRKEPLMDRPDIHPAKLVDGLYVLADLLIDADRTINGTYGHRGVWRDLPPEREAELDKILGTFDFLMTSKAVRAYADAWQAELDAEQA